jgi:uncharacterized protein (DUF58 family)
VPTRTRSVFPLEPRYRVTGLPLGGSASLRRGHGSDVAGSRAYVPGDPISTIDWRASARLSTARGRDEFVVRERYAEEAPRVIVLCDRRPSMGLYPPPFPWLSKPAAVRSIVDLIAETTAAHNASMAYLDYAGAADRLGRPFWLRPTGRDVAQQTEARLAGEDRFDAPEDGVVRGLEFLARFRSELSSGTFVFVVSDFLGDPVPTSVWLTAAARRWEVVPVVVQDAVWERSFPLVRSVTVPLVDPRDGDVFDVHVSARDARARRGHNERRHDDLRRSFTALGLDPVEIEASDQDAVDRAFVEWAARRRTLRLRR